VPYRWTIPVQKNFDKRLSALDRVPHAIPHEAPNSWFMRAAALQGCKSKEFAEYLGFDFGHDFDGQYYFVFRKTRAAAPQVQGLEPGRVYMEHSAKARNLGLTRFAPYRRRGRYRFCPLCLQSAQTPCIHMYTRMEELIFCPWHRCLLEDHCPHCKAHVDLTLDMIEPVKGKPGVEDLGQCLRCQRPRHEATALRIDIPLLNDMPFWLRHWGGYGPGPIEGAGMDEASYVAHRKRLAKAVHHLTFHAVAQIASVSS
jgi:hypothetical protein